MRAKQAELGDLALLPADVSCRPPTSSCVCCSTPAARLCAVDTSRLASSSGALMPESAAISWEVRLLELSAMCAEQAQLLFMQAAVARRRQRQQGRRHQPRRLFQAADPPHQRGIHHRRRCFAGQCLRRAEQQLTQHCRRTDARATRRSWPTASPRPARRRRIRPAIARTGRYTPEDGPRPRTRIRACSHPSWSATCGTAMVCPVARSCHHGARLFLVWCICDAPLARFKRRGAARNGSASRRRHAAARRQNRSARRR